MRHLAGQALRAAAAPAPKGPVRRTSARGNVFVTKYGTVTLSRGELGDCQRFGVKPEDYAAKKAKRLKQRRA